MSALDSERWVDAAINRIARKRRWSPINSRASIVIDDSEDLALMGATVYGMVRACGVAADGTFTDLLIELDQRVRYAGQFPRPEIRWLVTRPCLRWRRTNRLMFGWAAVRIVDAPSFRAATYDRTIGTGRIHLL